MSACASCGFALPEHNRLCPFRCQPQPTADHGISPAQLREKVEALEIRCAAISATASIAIGTVSDRLDAALKRIEQLEAQQARWRGAERYTEDEPEPCLTCAVRERSE